MESSKISFVLVNWNALSFLVGCIDSIKKNTQGLSYEIILVDNASTDGSQIYIKNNYPEIILIENDSNLGFSKANNLGINASTGNLLFLVNTDVIVLEGCISQMVTFMIDNPSVGMAGPCIFNSDMTKQTSCSRYPGLWNHFCGALMLNKLFPNSAFLSSWRMDYWDHRSTKVVNVLSGCFWVIRRLSLEEVGLLDENFFIYGEDVDWSRRFNFSKWDVCFNSDAQAVHFGGASSSRMPIKFYLEMQIANLQYWRKHHGAIKVIGFKLIIVLHHVIRLSFRVVNALVRNRKNEIKASIKIQQSIAVIKWAPFA
ncbi:MAG: GT2 family glycosyltransferase [Colwellia sp.]|jgi:GT2 family glycosyltransferase